MFLLVLNLGTLSLGFRLIVLFYYFNTVIQYQGFHVGFFNLLELMKVTMFCIRLLYGDHTKKFARY